MEEARGSIPLSSTQRDPLAALAEAIDLACWCLGGFVAGEGSFTRVRRGRFVADGSTRYRFRFEVTVATTDRSMLEALRSALGAGGISDRRRTRNGWAPTSTYRLEDERSLTRVVVPFAHDHLLPSAKRRQFDRWRTLLGFYLVSRPTGWRRAPTICTEHGCVGPVRARGLCRHHYYRATGH